MDYSDFLPVITAQAAALADAARATTLDARVPSCPEWDVSKLVRHTGTAQRWSNGVVRTRQPLAHKSIDLAIPEDRSGLPDWLEAGAAELAATLAGTDPDAECWTWTDDHHVRFWARRMALETAVHRWDAQGVRGEPEPIDGGLAVEGIDEHLANVPSMTPAEELAGTGETLHLHCTDRAGEWMLRLGPDGLVVSREHAKGDVALKGSASDLYLVLVGRIAADAVDLFGDPAVLDRWQTLMHF
jgi:uncharacterized protein (TIGR03083 family)